MNIKITSGTLRGRTIKSPDSSLTHPMGAREKLALFNMVSAELAGARVLDAFAGSGALGIEALSRGAGEVVFVEKNPKIAGVIRNNLKELGLTGKVITGAVSNFVPQEQFDLIIADPPYDDFRIEEVLKLMDILKADGTMVLSHPGEAPELPGLELQKTRKYAGASISIYTHNANA